MNDYGTGDAPAPDFNDRDAWFRSARARVQAPGTCLLVYGIISVFLAVLSLGIYAAAPDAAIKPLYDWQDNMIKEQAKQNPGQAGQQQALPPYDEYRKQQMISGIIGSALSLVCSVFIFLAGSKMKNLQGYGLAITGSILSIIPCTNSCCCVGTPLGIWALVVLLNSDVKLAFTRSAQMLGDRDVPQDDWDSRSERPRDDELR